MAQRITMRVLMTSLHGTFQNDLVPAQTVTAVVPNCAQLLDVQYDDNRLMAYFAFDAETAPDDCVTRTFLVVPGEGNVPDGNYQHCATVRNELRQQMRLHVFELVESSGS
jgi:hypothetical protein